MKRDKLERFNPHISGGHVKYPNPYYKKKKNTFILEVSCGFCKYPVALYAKAGKGNLIKMQLPRIVASEVDLEAIGGHFVCPQCYAELAKRGTYRENRAYWILRGRVHTKKL